MNSVQLSQVDETDPNQLYRENGLPRVDASVIFEKLQHENQV